MIASTSAAFSYHRVYKHLTWRAEVVSELPTPLDRVSRRQLCIGVWTHSISVASPALFGRECLEIVLGLSCRWSQRYGLARRTHC